MTKNVLFILTDQFRADCLSCAGHPILETPHLDFLAASGVRFTRAYTPQAVCAPARASISTGRYVQSHRVWWNEAPWPQDEKLMGDYLKELGVGSYQCGKSHYMTDLYRGLPEPKVCVDLGRGFKLSPFPDMETIEFNDGWFYNYDYRADLGRKGYPVVFVDWPHQVLRPDGAVERWRNDARNCHLPGVLKAEDTDTAFTSRRALEFLEEAPRQPWMLFLSYYRPHQPYCPSVPYYQMYPAAEVPAPTRSQVERTHPHPLWRAQAEKNGFLALLEDESYWRWMRSAYFGLIAELDDWVGRVLQKLRDCRLLENTLIVFSSDHGDYLGDHWLFGKESFYDQAHRVPLIILDPTAAADKTRGKTCGEWVQLVDILPTLIDWFGGAISRDIEGRSLLPLVRGHGAPDWRTAVYAAWDYRAYHSPASGASKACSKGIGVRDHQYNYWSFPRLGEVLFDLERDPEEFINVADRQDYRAVITAYRGKAMDHLLTYTDSRRVDWRFEKR